MASATRPSGTRHGDHVGSPGRVPHSAPARPPPLPAQPAFHGRPLPHRPAGGPGLRRGGSGLGDPKRGLESWAQSLGFVGPRPAACPCSKALPLRERPGAAAHPPAAVTSRPAIPAHLGPGPGFRTSEMPRRVERARGWLRRPSGGRGRAAQSPPPAGGGEGERAGAPRGARPAAGWGQPAGPPLAHPSVGSPTQVPRPRLSRQPRTGVDTTGPHGALPSPHFG